MAILPNGTIEQWILDYISKTDTSDSTGGYNTVIWLWARFSTKEEDYIQINQYHIQDLGKKRWRKDKRRRGGEEEEDVR